MGPGGKGTLMAERTCKGPEAGARSRGQSGGRGEWRQVHGVASREAGPGGAGVYSEHPGKRLIAVCTKLPRLSVENGQ